MNEVARNVFVDGMSLPEISSLKINDANDIINNLDLDGNKFEIAEKISREISTRLSFLVDVGLDYLNLSRGANTLSGGEAQRIRLASQIGSGLVGVIYVLDEPSIGLHQRDNQKLISTLLKLRDLGNTVIVVEHDEEMIRSADHIIDLGVGAGIHGGSIVAEGPLKKIAASKESVTAEYLRKEKVISLEKIERKDSNNSIYISEAKTNNLNSINVDIPLNKLVAITGVSGSGKSSLINHTLIPGINSKLNNSKIPEKTYYKKILGEDNIDKLISIDQSAIGKHLDLIRQHIQVYSLILEKFLLTLQNPGQEAISLEGLVSTLKEEGVKIVEEKVGLRLRCIFFLICTLNVMYVKERGLEMIPWRLNSKKKISMKF